MLYKKKTLHFLLILYTYILYQCSLCALCLNNTANHRSHHEWTARLSSHKSNLVLVDEVILLQQFYADVFKRVSLANVVYLKHIKRPVVNVLPYT